MFGGAEAGDHRQIGRSQIEVSDPGRLHPFESNMIAGVGDG